MNHTDTLRLSIAAILATQGFALVDGPALATKSYDTAVGRKAAIVWLSPARPGDNNRTLSGEYQSEGRNILGASLELIPVDADAATIERQTRKFMAHAERMVAESYAVRLLAA